MGLPGFSGFAAELQVLVGAWRAFPTLAVIAGIGLVVGVAYTLRALLKAFFSDQPAGLPALIPNGPAHSGMPPITVPEKIGAVILMVTSLLIGLFPSLLLNLIVPSLSSSLFNGLRQIAAP